MGFLGKSSGGSTVGIDIGSSLIKVVEAKPGKDGIEITALGIAPTPQGAIENETIVDPQALGLAIKELLAESGISSKKTVSSVSGQASVIVRIIEVPKMTTQELAETMKWEVERHVPFAADEVVMDFLPVERPNGDPDDQNMEVLLAVAQQEVITSHIEALFAAGLEPVAIDVEPLAASRALIDASSNGEKQGTVAIVSIGAEMTDLGVYREGLLAFPRTLPLAGNTISRTLSENLGISIEDAERLKRERAVVLMDRAAQIISGPSINDGQQDIGGYGPVDATMGMIGMHDMSMNDTPAQDSQQDMSNNDLGFIPGLGYGFGQETDEPKPSSTPAPDFDIDFGNSAPAAPRQVMDFDLSTGFEDAVAGPPNALDLSGPMGGMDDGMQFPSDINFNPSSSDDMGQTDVSKFTDEQIFDAMASALGDLISEIRRSLEYYTSRFQSQPDKIILCGGTARLKDLDKLLQSELGIPVVLANPLQNVTVLSSGLSQDYLAEVATILPVSLGLAIRDMIGE